MVRAFSSMQNEPFSSRKEYMCTSLVMPSPQAIAYAGTSAYYVFLETMASNC
jgi:hypothetical protein